MKDKIVFIIAQTLGVDPNQVLMETHFVDDLGADSLDTVELVMSLEEEWMIDIPDEDAEKMCIVQEVVDYIQSKVEGRDA